MKTTELLKMLKKNGCHFESHGTRHDNWRSPTGELVRVPRHKNEIPSGTLDNILKAAGLK